MAGSTLFDKIWDSHVVADLGEGWNLLHIDRQLLHDLSGSRALEQLEEGGLTVREPSMAFATADHAVSTAPGRTQATYAPGKALYDGLRDRSAAAGIAFFGLNQDGQGIVHVMGPELGIVLPGVTLICGDSHTCTNGALGAAPTPDGKPRPPSTEMDRKAEALRRAIQQHMQALAEQARRDGTLMPFDPANPHLSSQDFDRTVKEMRDAARAGRMDEARDKMAQLERMLEQLKEAEANANQPGRKQQRAQQRQRGRNEMGAAEDLVQRETKLQAQARARTPTPDQPANPGTPPDATAARETEGRQQRAMRRALGEMMQQFGDLTGKVPDSLSDADIAMRDAAGALANAQDKPAAEAEQRAIDALRKGQQQMSQQMASSLGIVIQPGEQSGQQQGEGQEGEDGQGEMADGQDQGPGPGGDQPGQDADNGDDDGQADGTRHGGQRDPLGRPANDGTSGRADSGNVHVPDQMEQARTRDIQNELRRRGADRTRPAEELDYIDRLLKPF